MSTRMVIAMLALLSLIGAAVLLWTGDADEAGPRAAPGGERATEAAPRAELNQRPLAAASPLRASAPVMPPSAPPPSDPFAAFLQAAKDKPAASSAPQPAQPAAGAAPDPFKAAVEAGRRVEPVPLVSPFGSKN